MNTNIGLTPDQQDAVALLLNRLLADEFVLYTKAKFYHWNVEGNNFLELHGLFDQQAETILAQIDEIAERVRALGRFSAGRLNEFLELTQLHEDKSNSILSKEMIYNLLKDHETIIRTLRQFIVTTAEKLNDAGTSDMLTGIMQAHEKMAWMLRSYR